MRVIIRRKKSKKYIFVIIAIILGIIYYHDLSEKKHTCDDIGGELVQNYAGQHVCVGGGK